MLILQNNLKPCYNGTILFQSQYPQKSFWKGARMLKLVSGEPGSLKSGKKRIDTWVIPVCEDKEIYEAKAINDIIKKAGTLAGFKGEKKEEATLYDVAGVNAKTLVFIGIGKHKEVAIDDFRQLAGNGVKKGITGKQTEVLIAVPTKGLETTGELLLSALMEGGFLANHIFDQYKGEKKAEALKADLLFYFS